MADVRANSATETAPTDGAFCSAQRSAQRGASDRATAPDSRADEVGMRVGILGGGQLARMLASAALRAGHQPVVLASDPSGPAALPGVEIIVGELSEEADLRRIAAAVDRLTIENEFLNIDAMRAALAAHPSVTMMPPLPAIAVAQDKLAQKALFRDLGIPTSRHEIVCSTTLRQDAGALMQSFPGGCMLKWSRYGYDGRGNLPARDIDTLLADDTLAFCREAEARGGTVYAEELIDFETELAMVATRASTGELVCFPLVVSVQEDGVCREVFGPAASVGIDVALEAAAVDAMARVGDALDMYGSFALEFFATSDGQLLANEMAPRVHNTGHYSLFDDEVSQFDAHIHAVTGHSLQRPETTGYVAMRNLLAPATAEHRALFDVSLPSPPSGVRVDWYDKRSLRPGRKMGHLTGRAESVSALDALRRSMREYEEALWHHLLKPAS